MPIDKTPSEEVERAFMAALGPRDIKLKRKNLVGGQVYTISLKKLAEGRIEEARQIGWQCLTSERTAAVGGDIASTWGGSAALIRGPVIDATMKTLNSISADERFNTDTYELRILRLPPLAIEAFWLHSINHKTDLVVLHTSQHPELVADKPYSMDEFLRIIRPLIEKFSKQPRYPL